MPHSFPVWFPLLALRSLHVLPVSVWVSSDSSDLFHLLNHVRYSRMTDVWAIEWGVFWWRHRLWINKGSVMLRVWWYGSQFTHFKRKESQEMINKSEQHCEVLRETFGGNNDKPHPVLISKATKTCKSKEVLIASEGSKLQSVHYYLQSVVCADVCSCICRSVPKVSSL